MTATAPTLQPRRLTASAWVRLRHDEGLRLAVALAVGMRVLLGVWALLSLALHGSGASIEAHPEAATPEGARDWPLVGPWERWDGLWYLHIARGGYPPGGPEAAFAPLFPLLARTAGFVAGGDVALGAWTVVTLALAAALWATWHLVDDALGPVVARRALLALALYPPAFFLLAPYPEGLFLALSAAALLAARRRAWGPAGTLAALAVLCRPQGAVLVVAMAVEALTGAWPAGTGEGPALRALRAVRSVGVRPLAALALPTATLAAWFLYCRIHLGLRLGPLTALSTEWGHRFVWPWQVLADSAQSIASGVKPEEIGNLLLVGLLVALLPLLARRLPPAWTVYVVLVLALSLFNEPMWTPLMSLMRYGLALAPVFALVASLTLPRGASRGWRFGRAPWLFLGGLALAAQGLLVDMYVHHLFVA